ncbi:MAG: 50S ribosomal protein L29 [Elusimicrobiota bacterium]|nr:50S ribosomal protein L29 [Elusimicrobiota bacterium]
MADKKTKTAKPAALGPAELKAELAKNQAERAKLSFQHNVAPLKNPMELRRLRRDIARLKTALRAQETAK